MPLDTILTNIYEPCKRKKHLTDNTNHANFKEKMKSEENYRTGIKMIFIFSLTFDTDNK